MRKHHPPVQGTFNLMRHSMQWRSTTRPYINLIISSGHIVSSWSSSLQATVSRLGNSSADRLVGAKCGFYSSSVLLWMDPASTVLVVVGRQASVNQWRMTWVIHPQHMNGTWSKHHHSPLVEAFISHSSGTLSAKWQGGTWNGWHSTPTFDWSK